LPAGRCGSAGTARGRGRERQRAASIRRRPAAAYHQGSEPVFPSLGAEDRLTVGLGSFPSRQEDYSGRRHPPPV